MTDTNNDGFSDGLNIPILKPQANQYLRINAAFTIFENLLMMYSGFTTNSPHFTGVPTAPTAAVGTNTDQIATMAAVKAAIDALVAGAPGALDTLNEIAAQLASDESAASALATAISNEVTNRINADALKMSKSSNLSDVANVATSRSNLGLNFYDIGLTISGKPVASAIVMRIAVVRAFTLPVALTSSRASSGTSATATTVLSIRKSGVEFGTATWAAGSTNATLAASSAMSFAYGDVLSVVAPSTIDATLADISLSIVGALV
jgi:hypothetical protein